MFATPPTIRFDLRRWCVALPGLMLLLGLVIGGVHHHEGGIGHPCAVCTVSHSTSTAAVERATLAGPTMWSERIVLAAESSRPSRPTLGHRGRAPPQS